MQCWHLLFQAHATCYKQMPVECSFGCLREIMLPPYVLTVPRMDVPMEICLGFPKKPTVPVLEELSSSGDSKTEEDREEKRSPKEKDGRDREKEEGNQLFYCDNHHQMIHCLQYWISQVYFYRILRLIFPLLIPEIVRIFDGNSSLKKRIYRTVAVPKNAPAQVLLVRFLSYNYVL